MLSLVLRLTHLSLCQLKQVSLLELLSTPAAECSPDLRPQFRRENTLLADLCQSSRAAPPFFLLGQPRCHLDRLNKAHQRRCNPLPSWSEQGPEMSRHESEESQGEPPGTDRPLCLLSTIKPSTICCPFTRTIL